MSFNPGQNVGPYRVIGQLGQGGMATVFKAYHAALDRYVAIKVLHPAFKEDPNFLARFQREARIVAKLDHPHIVPIYDFNEHEGMPYLVMRYVEGQTLKARLAEGPLPREHTLRVIKLAGEALAYAHEQGVLHRDIKPSNIMLTPAGGVYLTDFGLARIAQSGETTLSRDMMIGTPQYISPEQAKGEELDERTDIYSLGVVIFELLTGRVPFSADTPYAVVHDHIYSPLPLPRKIAPDLSPAMERVILKALTKEKEDRYQTVTELVAAFEKATLASKPAVKPVEMVEEEIKGVEMEVEMEMEAEMPPAVPVAEEPVVSAPPVEAEEEGVPPPISEAIHQAETAVDVPKPQRSRWVRFLVIGAALLLLLCLCGFMVLAIRKQRNQAISATATAMVEATPAVEPTVEASPPPQTQLESPSPSPTASALPSPGTPRPEDREQLERALEAVEENPNDPQAHLDLARAYVQTGDPDNALEEYRQTVELDPTLIDAYIEAGELLIVGGDWEEATTIYEMALEQDPDNLLALVRAGYLRAFQDDWEEAIAHFQRAVELEPNVPAPHAGLGICLVASGELEEGHRELEEALTLDPDWPEAHFGLGLYYAATGDREEALEEFNFVLQAENTPTWLYRVTVRKIEELGEIEGDSGN